jgi:hypothetical protein
LRAIFIVKIFIDNVFNSGVKSQCETKDGCHVNQTLPKVPQDVRRDVVGHKKADVHEHNASKQDYASRAVVYPILGIPLHICT